MSACVLCVIHCVTICGLSAALCVFCVCVSVCVFRDVRMWFLCDILCVGLSCLCVGVCGLCLCVLFARYCAVLSGACVCFVVFVYDCCD